MRDLNDLQFFATVVTEGSFSAAARALGVPKSRLSRRVALFEQRLGVRLLERSTRHLNVTEVGQAIYDHARAVLTEADAIDDVALRSRTEPRGMVRISCPFGLTASLCDSLAALLERHPHLRVRLLATNRRVDLIEEGVDVSIRIRERLDTDADLMVKRIGLSKRILVAAPTLLGSLGTPEMPTDLARFPLLSQEEQRESGAWTLTNRAGERAVIRIQPRLASGDFGVLASAARRGLGIALLPRADFQGELDSGALVRVLPAWDVADGILHLAFTSRRGMLPSVRVVIDSLAEALRGRAD